MAHIVLINPRFEVSYWGMEYAMQIAGKGANLPVSVLPLLAALTPAEHQVTLIDENVEAIDPALIESADIVGITGMSVQRFRMRELISMCKARGKFVAVGGAWITVSELYFGAAPNVTFIGEADETWPQFLADWSAGKAKRRYEQGGKTDMSTLPTPRFELLKMDRYAFGSIQISRGCPFLCEFCDIIVTFGRKPRIKDSAQVIAELEALRAQRIHQVFIVDDNFVGNKKVVRALLKDLVDYQASNGYPFRFFTEASLDLSEDDELMSLMTEANINAVFIGLESPNEASLKETHKLQNVKPKSGTMLERVQKIQDAGLEVWCGMIAGFDNDDEGIFDQQIDFLRAAQIPHIMTGMLYAIPKTPLHARLSMERRLDPADVSEYGTNVIPKNMSRAALRDGYMRVMKELHEPEAYFSRLEYLYLHGNLKRENLGRVKHWARHPMTRLKYQTLNIIGGVIFFSRLMRKVDVPALRGEYRRRIWRIAKATRDPSLIIQYVGKCAMHYHYHRLVLDLGSGRAINTL